MGKCEEGSWARLLVLDRRASDQRETKDRQSDWMNKAIIMADSMTVDVCTVSRERSTDRSRKVAVVDRKDERENACGCEGRNWCWLLAVGWDHGSLDRMRPQRRKRALKDPPN